MCDCGNNDGEPLDEFPDSVSYSQDDLPSSMRIASPEMTVQIEWDEDMWVAFVEGAMAMYGFGDSPEEAMVDLMEELERVIWN